MAQKNILFIMYEQLRFDYPTCAGNKTLHTPNFDWVAVRGARFTNAYVQSSVCGDSRMSTYTGRYVASHGAIWNKFPIRVGDFTLGDHLRRNGMSCWLLGKTHMQANKEGMARLGISRESIIGVRQSECEFDPWVRDDGLHGNSWDGDCSENNGPYHRYLKEKGRTRTTHGRPMPKGLSKPACLPLTGSLKMPTSQPTSAKRTAKRPG